MIYSGFGNHFAGGFGQAERKKRNTHTVEKEPRTFGLSGSVGASGPNHQDDVKQVETLLGRTGHMDLKPTDGPTGYPGQRLVNGVKNFQKENGLKQDGYLRPDGPTFKKLRATVPLKKTVATPASQPKSRPKDGHDFDGVNFEKIAKDRKKQQRQKP